MSLRKFTLVVYVPSEYTQSLKEALFKAGAGKFDGYDCCCYETDGHGQFRPLEGSSPERGEHGQVEQVSEKRLEIFCPQEVCQDVKEALIKAHPYEVPAFFFIEHGAI